MVEDTENDCLRISILELWSFLQHILQASVKLLPLQFLRHLSPEGSMHNISCYSANAHSSRRQCYEPLTCCSSSLDLSSNGSGAVMASAAAKSEAS